jgi:rhamnosyl/mannosyltransferase
VKQKKLLWFYRPFLRKILKRSQVIIVSNSKYIQTSDYLSGYVDKIQIIPFGIDLARFAYRDEEKIEEIKSRYPGPLILFVGKLRYYKGLNYLIEAAKEVEGTILIVGKGALKNELEEKIKINNLINKIILVGEVSEGELSSYYQAANVFVLPSSHKSEAFGISLLEAMACGLPIISTELGTGTSFVNLNNKTGLVVPPRDTVTLSKAINYLLENKGLREKFGEASRERVRGDFSKELMVSRIKKLYIDVLKD